ncbi:MAG: MraY family glycosyltransferase [Patescibacteria group bacterium]|nr:MraY family glycosyltransferase [Patescibacteria group bacterium]
MLTKLIITFGVAFVVCAACTYLVRAFSRRHDIVDEPKLPRKKHGRPVALMGGIAIAVSIAAIALFLYSTGWLPGEYIKSKYLIGIAVAVAILALGGVIDDRFDMKPSRQIIFPVLATFVIIASGIGVTYITNPLGGLFHLDEIRVIVLWWDGIPYRLTLLADIFTLAWLMGMTYTTKFLDGLDGLVSGLVVIGGVVIAAVSMMAEVSQPDTALLALAVAGVFAGFLVFNIHPASIFLGEGGSTAAGFLLGVLAIISGGKIATTLLIIGLPLFDAVFVIIRRMARKRSPTSGDRSHLHFLLVDSGFNERQVVMLFWFVSVLFGTSTLFLRGSSKVVAIGVLFSLLLVALAGSLIIRKRKEKAT